MEEQVFVSVICLTYNHKNYIRDALTSFVNQKTHYKYEVIVHDDASSDGTADIVRDFAKKYPDIFVPVFETENKFSKFRKQGFGSITKDICFPLCKGKYICLCEGDDYWCDEHLIEKKVLFLEQHPEYCAYLHRTKYYNCETKQFFGFSNNSEKEYDFDFEDAIKLKSHTSGWLLRKSIYDCDVPEKLEFFRRLGDQQMALWSTYFGKVRYTPEVMSVWRKNVEGSWTKNNINGTQEQKILYAKKRIIFLKKVLKISKGRNKTLVRILINDNRVKKAELKNEKVAIFFFKVIGKILHYIYKIKKNKTEK